MCIPLVLILPCCFVHIAVMNINILRFSEREINFRFVSFILITSVSLSRITFIVAPCIMESIYIVHTQQMHFLLKWKSLNLHENTHNYRSYLFRSSTILRELVQDLAKVTLLLKHSVKLRRILCEDVAECREMAYVLFFVQTAQKTDAT